MDNLDDSADIFANSSVETVTEISLADLSAEDQGQLDLLAQELSQRRSTSPEGFSPHSLGATHTSDTSFVLNNIVSEQNPLHRIYCPFCTSDFGFEFLLKAHIKDTHLTVLHKILKTDPDDVEYQSCPFCEAKFYVRELLPRHIITKHELSIVNVFPSNSSIHHQCYFCQHKVLHRHYKLLTVHIEKKHYHEFEQYIYKKYSQLVKSCDDLRFLDNEVKLTTQIMTPGLSDEMEVLRTDDKVIYSRRPVFIKPILKVTYDSDKENLLESQESSPANVLDKANAMQAAKAACRKLRFDLPDSPMEEARRNIETRMKAFVKKEKKFKWKFNFRKKELSKQDSMLLLSSPGRGTPVKSPLEADLRDSEQLLRFKCGLCAERFNSNGLLLDHIRRRHRGIKLKSLYHCGECSAKFFRNSVLVQHCSLNHSPLCLKSKSLRSNSNF